MSGIRHQMKSLRLGRTRRSSRGPLREDGTLTKMRAEATLQSLRLRFAFVYGQLSRAKSPIPRIHGMRKSIQEGATSLCLSKDMFYCYPYGLCPPVVLRQ